ncbi:uncharacterized protein LOC125275977 isoform X2 [Megalobrama amblycephala]|uniref:uncharacterized protein LOC125275977 isoform X2 n=1 Tax=Megalobrama amblycephala TaxID=75352 RepID=UPI0020140BEE|nr:uncharacterized protein LOC125275977 isoform X2 [Megalobrama amblycephala]
MLMETDSAGLSIESDRTIGQHTAVPPQRDKLVQINSGAPAPGLSLATATMRRKSDEPDEPEEKNKKPRRLVGQRIMPTLPM